MHGGDLACRLDHVIGRGQTDIMKHIAWLDLGAAFPVFRTYAPQQTIKTHCGLRVRYGQHVNHAAESDCVDCVQAVAISARLLEVFGQSVLKGRNPYEAI